MKNSVLASQLCCAEQLEVVVMHLGWSLSARRAFGLFCSVELGAIFGILAATSPFRDTMKVDDHHHVHYCYLVGNFTYYESQPAG